MKYLVFFLLTFLLISSCATAQVYLGANGLNVSGTGTSATVNLGGTLTQNTDIDLNSVYNLNFKNGSSSALTILSNGNVGIGTTSPTASFHIATPSVANRDAGPFQFAISDGAASRFFVVHDVAATREELLGPASSSINFIEGSDFGLTVASGNGLVLTAAQNLLYNGAYHLFEINGTEMARISAAGVGIGTTAPAYNLDVNGTARIANNAIFQGATYFFNPLNYVAIGFSDLQNPNAMVNFPGDGSIGISTGASASARRLTVLPNGNVGIGTANPQATLAVNGSVFAQKVKVTQTGWSDYVFEKKYKLLTLEELEQFIQHNKHLPEVPSADDVQKDGIDLGDNQATLLKKVEELTLYVIAQNKKIEMQQKRIEALEKKSNQKK